VAESEIWQIIQTANEISVMRIEVFITITVGVLIISSIQAIRLSIFLLCILLVTYLVFGYINFGMTVGEMEILLSGIQEIHSMIESGQDVSLMGQYLATHVDSPLGVLIIPILHISYWAVSVATITYSIWRYVRQESST
jgi:hypothetical protein